MKVTRRRFLGGVGGASLCGGLAGARAIDAAEWAGGPDEADVLIIGAGASGAAAAWRLARAGLKVVCLEQGDWLDYVDAPAVKPDWELIRQRSWNPNPNVRRLAVDYPVNDAGSALKPLMYNAVGGSTILWSCHAPRFHPSDFRTATLDGVGRDWPLTYDELAPYYDLNDTVCGMAGVAGDPAYPPHAAPRLPPVPIGRGARRIAQACDRLGWHWWPSDIQINSEVHGEGRGVCNHCGPCELSCPFGAKGSTDFTYWPLALDHGARLVTRARVFEIETDAHGRATGAAYYDRDGRTHRQRARITIVAANGVGTPRLLLLSRSRRHPAGLANASDQVGRNLMLHPVATITGVFDEPMDGYRGITACSIASHQFYETDAARDFKRGYMIQVIRSVGPVLTALGAYGVPMAPGPDHHRRFLDVFNRTVTLATVSEDLADPDNRITLDPELADGHGIPAPKMTYRLGDNTRRMLAHGIDRCQALLAEAGARETHTVPVLEDGGFHLMGTARMGDDPASSVVDRWGRAHDADNLFIVDGSVFTTAAAVNPTITIQALALRTADHIVETRRDG